MSVEAKHESDGQPHEEVVAAESAFRSEEDDQSSAPVVSTTTGGVEDPQLSPTAMAERIDKLERLITTLTQTVEKTTMAQSVLLPNMMPYPVPATAEEQISSWFHFESITQFRNLGRMYLDARYRLSRMAQFGVPAVVCLLLLNYLFFNLVFDFRVISPILERMMILLLAFALYRILGRELLRYRRVLEYLANLTQLR